MPAYPQSFCQINGPGPWTAAATRVVRVPPTTCVNYDSGRKRRGQGLRKGEIVPQRERDSKWLKVYVKMHDIW